MLTREDDVDAHALRRQGWTISAIARHLGRDRKTIRSYLSGDRVGGVWAASVDDPLGPFVAYLRQRLVDDPHGVGHDAVRRGTRAGVRPFLSPVHPRPARPSVAAALRAMPGLPGPGSRGDRSSGG
jgi:hypothetical protein